MWGSQAKYETFDIPKKDVFTILSHPSVKVSPCFANVNFDRYLVTSIEQALRRTLDLPLPWPACHGLPAMENKPYTMENVHINVRRKTSWFEIFWHFIPMTWDLTQIKSCPSCPPAGEDSSLQPPRKMKKMKNLDSAVWICSKRKQGSRDTNAFNNIVHANIKLFRHPSYYYLYQYFTRNSCKFFIPAAR